MCEPLLPVALGAEQEVWLKSRVADLCTTVSDRTKYRIVSYLLAYHAWAAHRIPPRKVTQPCHGPIVPGDNTTPSVGRWLRHRGTDCKGARTYSISNQAPGSPHCKA